jgi:indolepyruvate ferredoxin oxidoreductase
LTVVQTDYGPKIQTDLSWCVNDGACARIDACPSFEEVIVIRRRRPTPRGHKIMLEDIPEVPVRFDGDVWRVWLAGVGGMGIGTAGSILVVAGQHEGYEVHFCDKKGLAIRNGAVYSQIAFSRPGKSAGITMGYGKADLLLGLDPLEAVRAVDGTQKFRVAAPERTATVVNTDVSPTIRVLLGWDSLDVDYLEQCLRQATRADRYFSARISSLCERIFGTKLYMNITMLGIAYQRGLIPVSLDSLKEGIRQTIRADFKENLRAFEVGRKLVSRPDLFADLFGDPPGSSRSLARIVREKAAYLNMRLLGKRRALREDRPGAAGKRRLPDTKLARIYKHIVFTTLRACRELDRQTMRHIAIRIYDLIQWGGVRHARRYVQRIRRTFLADQERYGFAATRAVVWNLAKLMLIKDEFYVAHLLTGFEKIRRDRQRYNVNPSNGDRLRYRRTFHPRLFGRQFDIRIPHWSLYVLRNFRFLRSVIPFWRRDERQFLRWYEAIVDRFAYSSDAEYDQYLEILMTVEAVRGYAEIRRPKMEAAQSKAEQLLAGLGKSGERRMPTTR